MPTKIQKLLATFDSFYDLIAEIPGDCAEALRHNWKRTRSFYENIPAGVRPSQLTSGLEEGLREMPSLFEAADPEQRSRMSKAFSRAIADHYPDFFQKQRDRLEKILAKGKISRESEYYAIRHHVDILEGDEDSSSLLRVLYQMIDVYEATR
ncbi:MAG: hypothetical protein JO142_02540 [Burkholderiales bacterium]|nr:hypothetical protein [Burkholderiales bacterium]